MEDRPIMLWHYAFYDCPLDGVAMYKDNHVWFSCSDMGGWDEISDIDSLDKYYYDTDFIITDPFDTDRKICCKYTFYKLYELPENIYTKYKHNHELYQRYVGYHHDYPPGPVNENQNIDDYMKQKLNIDYKYSDHKCLGEFRNIDFISCKR